MQSRRLLMISTDRTIFDERSAVRARQIWYAKGWEETHIIVFAKRNEKAPSRSISETVLASNCWAYSTRSHSKFLYPFDAIKLGRFIIEKRGITDITCQDASLTAMAGVSLKKELATHGKDVRLEIQVHEDIGSPLYAFNWSNKIRKTLALKYLPHADSIRTVSERVKRYLTEVLKIEGSKIEVRPIVVDIESIKSAPVIAGADLHERYPQFDKIVLMVGRLEAEKNVGAAIRAWPFVIEKHPKAALVIVGRGSLKNRLETRAKELCGSNGGNEPQAAGSIVFEGWAEKPALYSYYKTADLFLNTSLFEGYGMALVEAHAAGCKIVSTDVGVIGDVLKDGASGVSVVDRDAKSVADGIIRSLGV